LYADLRLTEELLEADETGLTVDRSMANPSLIIK
jgi:hypothetical protein